MHTKIKFPCYMKQIDLLSQHESPYVIVTGLVDAKTEAQHIQNKYPQYWHYHLDDTQKTKMMAFTYCFVKVSKKEAVAAVLLQEY